MRGSIWSLWRRLPTFPPSALARAEGFLLAASMAAGASGAPWFDRLGIDPAWLLADASDSVVREAPRPGLSVASRADLALREPLHLDWGGSEFLQTMSGDLRTGSGTLSPWIQVARTASTREIATSTMSVEHPQRDQGLRGGARFEGSWLETRFESGMETERQFLSGSLRIARNGSWVEAGASRAESRSDLDFQLPEGDLELEWRDRTDSLGASVGILAGWTNWTASIWRRESRSPATEGLVDTGRTTGWDLGVSLATGWGVWNARYARDRSDLHTVGVLDERIFHDKNWQSLRGVLGMGWRRGSWSVEAETRRLRAELVPGGIDQAFVDWNMVPLDAFTRVGAVLGSRSEYLAGHLEVQRWSALLSRSWTRDRSGLSIGLGGSWIGFEGRIDRTTLEVRGLFPYLTDDIPFDGSGWIALAEARIDGKLSLGSLGFLVARGVWHQPLAGGWKPAASGTGDSSSSASSGTGRSPVDPLGFHQASLQWMLAW